MRREERSFAAKCLVVAGESLALYVDRAAPTILDLRISYLTKEREEDPVWVQSSLVSVSNTKLARADLHFDPSASLLLS